MLHKVDRLEKITEVDIMGGRSRYRTISLNHCSLPFKFLEAGYCLASLEDGGDPVVLKDRYRKIIAWWDGIPSLTDLNELQLDD